LELVARAGHGDVIVLADAGLKIPAHTQRIDLELTPEIPTMTQVLDAVLTELVVEGATVAEEMATWNPELDAQVLDRLSFEPRRIPHTDFASEMASSALAYVKTGECTAYASVALVCGVSYFNEAVERYEKIQRQLHDKVEHPR
jgi:D-ribose pyranase